MLSTPWNQPNLPEIENRTNEVSNEEFDRLFKKCGKGISNHSKKRPSLEKKYDNTLKTLKRIKADIGKQKKKDDDILQRWTEIQEIYTRVINTELWEEERQDKPEEMKQFYYSLLPNNNRRQLRYWSRYKILIYYTINKWIYVLEMQWFCKKSLPWYCIPLVLQILYMHDVLFFLKNTFLYHYFLSKKGKSAPSQKSNFCWKNQNLGRFWFYSMEEEHWRGGETRQTPKKKKRMYL